ncbi:MAG TPA: hypothetical protein DIS78_00810 [Lachnospiraceae bacterium]|nr:hypothetical protein [Lachnospiraceae bacterium]
MIRYYENLYLTDSTEKNLTRIKRRLRLGAGMTSLFVITLSDNPGDMFNIIHASMFKIRRIRHADHLVIGLAESRRKAYDIITGIVTGHYARTGGYDGIRDYFLEGKD